MTQTHILIAATLLTKSERPTKDNRAILLGSFAPDLAICLLFIWSVFAEIPQPELWGVIYFSEPMRTFTAIGNSLPLYLSLCLIGLCWSKASHTNQLPLQKSLHNSSLKGLSARANLKALTANSALALFSLGAISHLIGDFPVHAADAHPHFWPFTDWRFHSPISYWDREHHGDVFSFFEAALGIFLALILWRRYQAKKLRALTLIAVLSYLAVPAYFLLTLG